MLVGLSCQCYVNVCSDSRLGHPVSCYYSHTLQSSSVILQPNFMYSHHDNLIYDITVSAHVSCVWQGHLWCILPCALTVPSASVLESSCLHTLFPSFQNEFLIALLNSALSQWVWHEHCSSMGGSRPLGVRPNTTDNSTFQTQEEGKEMAHLV